jgi:hypothetical protein
VDVCSSTYYNTFEDDYSDQNESRASGAILLVGQKGGSEISRNGYT